MVNFDHSLLHLYFLLLVLKAFCFHAIIPFWPRRYIFKLSLYHIQQPLLIRCVLNFRSLMHFPFQRLIKNRSWQRSNVFFCYLVSVSLSRRYDVWQLKLFLRLINAFVNLVDSLSSWSVWRINRLSLVDLQDSFLFFATWYAKPFTFLFTTLNLFLNLLLDKIVLILTLTIFLRLSFNFSSMPLFGLFI